MPSKKTVESFETRVYLQGVCVYVWEEAEEKLSVLLPEQTCRDAKRIRTFRGDWICEHFAVVQFHPANVSSLPDAVKKKSSGLKEALGRYGMDDAEWSTLDLTARRLSFEARAAGGGQPDTDLVEGGRVRGVPYLPEVFQRAHLEGFDKTLLPGEDGGLERLKAWFTVDAGVLSPSGDYEGKYDFVERDGNGKIRKLPKAQARRSGHSQRREGDDEEVFATVLKLELGELESFELHFEDLSGNGSKHVVEFQPPCDELEIWVRHFCDLRRPDPTRTVADVGDLEDVDFCLNYALQDKLPKLLDLRKANLPVPRVVSSWARGRPVSDEMNKCMSSQGKK